MHKCAVCKEEKESVSPKVVAKTTSEDKRLASKTDVFVTKLICDGCYKKLEVS